MGENIRGSKAQGLPRPSATFPEDRICSMPGCQTKLSRYNRRDRCWLHAEMKIPRLRGRKPAPGNG